LGDEMSVPITTSVAARLFLPRRRGGGEALASSAASSSFSPLFLVSELVII